MKKILALCVGSLVLFSACSDNDGWHASDVISDFCDHEMTCNTNKYPSYNSCYETQMTSYDNALYDYHLCRNEISRAYLAELKNMTSASCEEVNSFYDGLYSGDTFMDKNAENRSTDCQIHKYGQKYF